MEPMRTSSSLETAIPQRYVQQRERVLRILARWQETTIHPSLEPRDGH